MNRCLIVNADDFGWTEGINEAIVDSHSRGIVTSATLLAGGAGANDAVRLAGSTPSLGVGVHLSYHFGGLLIDPRRLSAIYRNDGTARYGTVRLWLTVSASRWAREQLYEHFRSQIAWVLDKGITPTHLDTHKHVHYWPPVTRMLCRLADEFSIPAVRLLAEGCGSAGGISTTSLALAGLAWTIPINRHYIRSASLKSCGSLVGIGQTGRWTKGGLLGILERLQPGCTELMVHPGNARGLADQPTRLVASRQVEWDILTDPEVKRQCQSSNIELVNYHDLASRR